MFNIVMAVAAGISAPIWAYEAWTRWGTVDAQTITAFIITTVTMASLAVDYTGKYLTGE